MVERTSVYNLCVKETQGAMALKGKLKVVKNTIKRLRKDLDNSGQKTMMFWSKLSFTEAQLGSIDSHFNRQRGGLMRGDLRNVGP